MSRLISMARVWRRIELPDELEARVEAELQRWADTPYMSGQQMPGVGVDCIRFCCGFLDAMYGSTTKVPRLPPDTAFHDPAKAKSVLQEVLSQYQPNYLVTDGTIESGDFLFSNPAGAGPSHGMIAGRHGLWHANGRPGARGGVKMVGIALLARSQAQFQIWRNSDKRLSW